MKIGVVSDTHSHEIPKVVLNDFKTVDFIIHAGDFCSAEDLKVFTDIKDVKAVYGNMDDSDLQKKLPETQIITCEGFSIGIYHGEGAAPQVFQFVKDKFKGKKVDAVIFGHSHVPMNKVEDGVLYFNPGSPNDTIVAPYCSYGILEVKDGTLVGTIKKVNG